MKDGYIKVAAITPGVALADPMTNAAAVIAAFRKAEKAKAKIMVFPELCLTGASCGDLFFQESLLQGALEGLEKIRKATEESDALLFVGLPLEVTGKLYDTVALIQGGDVLAFIPKQIVSAGGVLAQSRHFTPGPSEACVIDVAPFGEVVFGGAVLCEIDAVKGLRVGCAVGTELFAPDSPGVEHAAAGATLLVHLLAAPAAAGEEEKRAERILAESERLLCGIVTAAAGDGESTGDAVFPGTTLIAENGTCLAGESGLYTDAFGETAITISELDVQALLFARRKEDAFFAEDDPEYQILSMEMQEKKTSLTRTYSPHPFYPEDEEELAVYCEEVLTLQERALARRLLHVGAKKAVLGISGGLDSTLTLLVAARAFDLAGLPRKDLHAITMPSFGTTDRTYNNACGLTKALGATLEEINIRDSVLQHFKDIGQSPDKHDVTYENAQARERTQVLMDRANQLGGLVIGTGDLSELALGWATYNGDHMSMYGTNAGLPKTLIRHVVRAAAEKEENAKVRKVLLDVLDTPVSPELLPPTGDGKISQRTEDLVGPYELHDFFLYHMLHSGFSPAKIYRIALSSFAGRYDKKTILQWEKTFYRRFFTQQFKRSCMPEGPAVGPISFSPRGGLQMPSDAMSALWLAEVEKIR